MGSVLYSLQWILAQKVERELPPREAMGTASLWFAKGGIETATHLFGPTIPHPRSDTSVRARLQSCHKSADKIIPYAAGPSRSEAERAKAIPALRYILLAGAGPGSRISGSVECLRSRSIISGSGALFN
jgi:hypothetical protein